MDHIRSTTVWCAQRRIVEFEFYHDDYRNLFDCKGTFALVEQGSHSIRIDIHADLYPYPERLPGLPVWVAKKGLPLVEKLIGGVRKRAVLGLRVALRARRAIADASSPVRSDCPKSSCTTPLK